MITFKEAYKLVMEHTLDWGTETVSLQDTVGRVLAEDVLADRDFPPFDRSTKDGIAINFEAIEKGIDSLKIEAVLSAGMPKQKLSSPKKCFEIMTGAVVPEGADTVVMYEEVSLENGFAKIFKKPSKGQNIHRRGSDEQKGAVVLKAGTYISPAEIGVLASVGKSEVLVKKLPEVCVVSTGNELVEVDETPLPHQIRKSNILSLSAALSKENISAARLHLADDKSILKKELQKALLENDVLLLSGGVSKGKFDFIPQVMEDLDVEKVFHRVAQRPGKPFWFGIQKQQKTIVFSFPGNPVSTFANYHVYFLPWLRKCLGLQNPELAAILSVNVDNNLSLTKFVQVKTSWADGKFFAKPIKDGGSGDLTSLSRSDGFICLRPRENAYEKGEIVPIIFTK